MNAAKTASWELVGLADEQVASGKQMGGFRVIGTPTEAAEQLPENCAFHVAIGNNEVRLRLAEECVGLGMSPASLISPRAEIAPDAQIGSGCFIGHFASIAPETVIEEQALINMHAVVGHEAFIGAGAQLCPGAVVTGRCRVGKGAFLGSNAVLQPCVSVGDWARISANTFAATDVEPGVTLATMPGRPVFARKRKG